jgi:hypothetical protein
LFGHGPDPATHAEAFKVTAVMPMPPAEPAKPTTVILTPSAAPLIARQIRPLDEARAPAMSLASPAPTSAPALPPAMSVASVPAPQEDEDHPVPPGSIPDAVPTNPGKVEGHSRLGALIARIPFVGRPFER